MPSRNDLEVRTNLGSVLTDLKSADKALARNLRRAIRASGDSVIAAAGKVLDTENPGAVTAKVATGGRRLRSAAGSTGRSRRNMRQAVKAGMASRVTNGARGATFRVTSAAAAPDLPAKALNRKIMRHPVFGNRTVWTGQKGLMYFRRGIESGGAQAKEALFKALEDAADQLRTNPPMDS